MFFIKKLVVLTASVFVTQFASATAFYYVAHPDDVELFMARQAASDVASGAKVVFIVTTAGDGGNGIDQPTVQNPWYLARQNGHEASLKYWYSLRGLPAGDTWTTPVNIAGRTVARSQIGGQGSNVIMYNMLLPNDFAEGKTVEEDAMNRENNITKLREFRDKSLTDPTFSITSIDGAQTYTWEQFKTFLINIIYKEQDIHPTWINIPEFDTVSSTLDSPDHWETGRAVTHALEDYVRLGGTRCIASAQYVGYATENLPINYSSYDRDIQRITWETLNKELTDKGFQSTNDPAHEKWLYKLYRSDKTPGGVNYYGPC